MNDKQQSNFKIVSSSLYSPKKYKENIKVQDEKQNQDFKGVVTCKSFEN